MLRTPDGRLCILDFGMTLDVPADLQLSLLEFIANLSAENYEEVPRKNLRQFSLEQQASTGQTVFHPSRI